MKGLLTVAGTVVLGTTNATGKERFNAQQVMIVTPRTAEALGLSYQNLFDALCAEKALPPGSPILVRLASEQKLPAVSGPVVQIPLEKVAPQPDRNAFIRS